MRDLGGTLQHGLMAGVALIAVGAATPAAAQTRNFNVPAQPAARSIPIFARQAGVQILASGATVRNRRTNAVVGAYPVDEALRMLLQGTGLEAHPEGSTGIITVRAVAARAVAMMAADMATAATATETAEADASSESIIVTGTLIRNPNLVASSPVAVFGARELALRNVQNAEQILRELPGSPPGIGSAVNNGNNGYSSADLRGLGQQRNLVLLDGSRIVPSNQLGVTDLNNIPVALLERVEVLTGGASTTYGADAVSGVVNFITRRNFAGLEASASEQISERGDSNYFSADLTLGANFEDGRGNVVLSIGYQQSDPLYQGDRDISIFGIGALSGVASGSSGVSVPTAISFPGFTGQVNPEGTLLVPIYSRFNFNPYNVFQTPFERFNIYGAARYAVSDQVEIYTRALFSKNSVDTIVAPSGVFGEEGLTVPADNPFLSAGIRDQLCARAGIPLGAACNSNQALPLPLVNRRTVELGPRVSDFATTMFDMRGGVRIDLSDSINLDLGGAYGQSELINNQTGYVLRSRVQQALNADNATTCDNSANGCVPLNLFGQAGSITPAMAAFLAGRSEVRIEASLAQARALLSGDLGIVLPWAANSIAFALGGEYRRYTYALLPDALAQSPGELGGAGDAVVPFDGGYNVKEAFGELNVPIAADRPGLNLLSFEAGLRYSTYGIDAPNNPRFRSWTYKAGITWEPIDAIRFRTNYQRAVRAPNISELFAPVGSTTVTLLVDPCAGTAPVGNANLTAICLAQGAPIEAIGLIENPEGGQANGTGGGNVNLLSEKADTFTVGVILQPGDLIPELAIAIDYFNITVDDAIAPRTALDAIEPCFGAITAASASSPACLAIQRNPVTGDLTGAADLVPGLPTPLTNLGQLKIDGIDVNIDYRRDFGAVTLTLGFDGNWTHSSTYRPSPTAPARECVGFYSPNCGVSLGQIQPEFSWSQRTTVTVDNVDLSLRWRHLSAVRYEPGLPPLFSGTITGPSPFAGREEDFNTIPAYDYFDLTVRFQMHDHLDLILGVENLFDKQPPVTGTGAGAVLANSGNTFPSTYDALGRLYNASVRLHF